MGITDRLEVVGIIVGTIAFFGIAFWRTNYSPDRKYVPETQHGGKRKTRRKK